MAPTLEMNGLLIFLDCLLETQIHETKTGNVAEGNNPCWTCVRLWSQSGKLNRQIRKQTSQTVSPVGWAHIFCPSLSETEGMKISFGSSFLERRACPLTIRVAHGEQEKTLKWNQKGGKWWKADWCCVSKTTNGHRVLPTVVCLSTEANPFDIVVLQTAHTSLSPAPPTSVCLGNSNFMKGYPSWSQFFQALFRTLCFK